MELDLEIEVKKQLQQAADEADDKTLQSNRLVRESEEILADAVNSAKAAGASITFIADAIGQSRQKVYIFLAMRGQRPNGGRNNENG